MTVTIALVQEASSTDVAANRARLASLPVPPADLVVLPEAFHRDFGGDEPLGADAEPLHGPFVSALVDAAGQHGGVWIAGMFERSDSGLPFNTLVVVDGSGVLASYRKLHLYDSFGYRESDRLTAGTGEPVVVPVAGLTVGLQTCYDLRFPEVSRALSRAGADLLVVPAAWVAGPRKAHHWTTLLTARAIENVSYAAGAGQPGPRYTGHSLVVDPRGETVASVDEEAGVVLATLDPGLVTEARHENPSLANRRD